MPVLLKVNCSQPFVALVAEQDLKIYMACIHPWGSYNDKKKGENELFLFFGDNFYFLENWLMMFACFQVGNGYWSADRIPQPCVCRMSCIAPVKGVPSFAGHCIVAGGYHRVMHAVVLPGPQWRHTAQNLQMCMYLYREKHLEIERFRHKMCSNIPSMNWIGITERERYIET